MKALQGGPLEKHQKDEQFDLILSRSFFIIQAKIKTLSLFSRTQHGIGRKLEKAFITRYGGSRIAYRTISNPSLESLHRVRSQRSLFTDLAS